MLKKRLARTLFLALLACTMIFLSGACAEQTSVETDSSGTTQETQTTESIDVQVASLKGPTSIGIVNLINDAKDGNAPTENTYEFAISGTADEILPQLINGAVDIAIIPANAASVLYNKTEGDIQVLNINNLGVLYVVSADTTVDSIDDLAGRTVYLTGKGTTPEYVFNTLLDEAGITGQVTMEFKTEATELAAAITADPTAIAVLPEPYVTAITQKNPELKRNISLTEAWKEATGEELITGVTVVRKEFALDHPEMVAEFQALHEASVAAANDDPAATAPLVVALGIVENERVAELSIPSCNLVSLTNAELKSALNKYLTALYNQDPTSIGGTLPSDDFYYVVK